MSRNRLTSLPAYMSTFNKLTVLKVDHNPIMWPPSDIMELPPDSEDPTVMQGWLANVKRWLEQGGDSPASQAIEDHPRVHSDSSICVERLVDSHRSV